MKEIRIPIFISHEASMRRSIWYIMTNHAVLCSQLMKQACIPLYHVLWMNFSSLYQCYIRIYQYYADLYQSYIISHNMDSWYRQYVNKRQTIMYMINIIQKPWNTYICIPRLWNCVEHIHYCLSFNSILSISWFHIIDII